MFELQTYINSGTSPLYNCIKLSPLPALVNRPINVGGCACPHCPWLAPKRCPQGVGSGRGRNHGRPWISSFATHCVVPASLGQSQTNRSGLRHPLTLGPFEVSSLE